MRWFRVPLLISGALCALLAFTPVASAQVDCTVTLEYLNEGGVVHGDVIEVGFTRSGSDCSWLDVVQLTDADDGTVAGLRRVGFRDSGTLTLRANAYRATHAYIDYICDGERLSRIPLAPFFIAPDGVTLDIWNQMIDLEEQIAANNEQIAALNQIVADLAAGGEVSWDSITGMPAGFADGIDDESSVSQSEVLAMVSGEVLDLGAGSMVAGVAISTGPHTTDTHLTAAQIVAMGFAAGPHTVDTGTHLTDAEVLAVLESTAVDLDIGSMVGGDLIVTTNTRLSEEEVDAYVANNGYATTALVSSEQARAEGVEAALQDALDQEIVDPIADVDAEEARALAAEAALQTALANYTPSWNNLTNMPEGFDDNVDNVAEGGVDWAEIYAELPWLQHVSYDTGIMSSLVGPHDIFSGANYHFRSGSGGTNELRDPTGRGNVFVGYNEPQDRPPADYRTGSHNFIVGPGHNYTSSGGFVAGHSNTISGIYSSVTGGAENVASGGFSSVSGGTDNPAYGGWSSVSGGNANAATGVSSSVSGGIWNTSSGLYASASGGSGNTASGDNSSVLAGRHNIASGDWSSVTGGGALNASYSNEASGDYATVTGGRDNTASGQASSVSAGHNNSASGMSSIVSDGSNRSALGDDDWVAGSLFQNN